MEFFFGGLLLIGIAYLLITSLGLGEMLGVEAADNALDTVGLSPILGLDDASGFGCSVLAAFMAGFGSIGLAGTMAGWSLPVIVLVALGVGYVLGRVVVSGLKFLRAQQSAPFKASMNDLIGKAARITLDAAKNKTGEAMIEEGEVGRYPVKEISGAELKRGDVVEVVDVQGRFLHVKKKRL